MSGGTIEALVRSEMPGVTLIHCPRLTIEKTGKIVDCAAQSSAAAVPLVLRVTQDDAEGHMHFEMTPQPALDDPVICSARIAAAKASALAFQGLPLPDPSSAPPDVITTWGNAFSAAQGKIDAAHAAGCALDGSSLAFGLK